MGKVDQGFVTLWAARHFFGGSLQYTGFGGQGLQVRDILHVDDLFRLVCHQIVHLDAYHGRVFNMGGGCAVSVSLRELTRRCARISGRSLPVGSMPESHPSDIPYYITDNTELSEHTGWRPEKSVDDILSDIFAWLAAHADRLKPIFV